MGQDLLGDPYRILVAPALHDPGGRSQHGLPAGERRNGTPFRTQMIVSTGIMLAGGSNLFFFMQANSGTPFPTQLPN